MTRSEFGGDATESRRPNGSVRHAGQALGESPLVHPSDVMRSLKLTADATGEEAVDLEFAWRGLDADRFKEINEAQEQVSPNGVSLAHNKLTDP